jgi:hypothetical protein
VRPAIGLRRMSLRSATEAAALGVGCRAFYAALAWCLVTMGCATGPQISGDRLAYSKSCRGWVTIPEPPQTLSRIRGLTILRDTGDLLPNVDLILLDRTSGFPLYSTRSNEKGQFDFGQIPEGKYLLKTCIEGFCTIEIEMTVATSAKHSPLRIEIPLSS